MRSWRYYRNLTLYYLVLALLVFSAAQALKQPVYWIATTALWLIHQAVRRAFGHAHPWRRISLVDQDLQGFKELTYQGGDGTVLSGRFASSRNQATVILAHGLGGSGKDLAVLARMLMRAGYGVFIPDLRAHGNSHGDTCTFGIKEGRDVACAVQFLLKRVDVNGGKLGAYGFSLGAQAVLRAALQDENIRALVLEDLEPAKLSDYGGRPNSLAGWIHLPGNLLYHAVYQFLTGASQRGVLEVIKGVAPRPIFLIASGPDDIHFGRLFYQAAGEPKELWEIPGAEHGGAILQDPNEYLDRLIRFFNRSLNVEGGLR